MKTHTTKRIYRVRCKSGLIGWRTRLRNVYSGINEWFGCASTYGLDHRLGYKDPAAAWKANPVIEGSINANDYRKVKS